MSIKAVTDGSTSPAGAPESDVPGVLAPPPLIYLGGLAVGFGLEAMLPSAALPRALSWGLGGSLLVGGGALARSFFRALAGSGTPVSPYRASTGVVTTGPYSISRNPGYLGMALIYSGVALLSGGSLWPLASLLPTLIVIDRGVIRREERYLERKFGAEYLQYKHRVRRWI